MSRSSSQSSSSSRSSPFGQHSPQRSSPQHSSRPSYSHLPPSGYLYPPDNATLSGSPRVDANDLNSHTYPEDQYYYPPAKPSHPLYEQATHPHGRYRPQRPPPPHPPAPPAPPRSSPYRKSYQPSQLSIRSSFLPTVSYHRAHGEPDGLQGPWGPPHSRVGLDQRGRAPRSNSALSQSAGTGSGIESGTHEHTDGDVENTPSPIDPERIQQWERTNGDHNILGGGSHHGEDEGHETIGTPFAGAQNGLYNVSQRDADIHPGGVNNLDTVYSQKRPNAEYYPSAHHQAQFQALAENTGVANAQRGSIGLNSLADSELGGRPAYPLPTIIKCAILGSPHQRLTLSELYLAMEMRFPYYKNSDKKAWRNSVRHNLSLNNQFAKKERPITEPGKGHYWVVVPDMPQGNKRERKRNKKPGKRAQAELAAAEREQAASKKPNGSGETTLVSQASPSTVGPPAVLRGYVTGTIPATAGSYAAVTGALPAPPPLDRQLFRPWDGNVSLSKSSEEVQDSRYVSTSTEHEVQRPGTPPSTTSNTYPARPQFEESSMGATAFASPAPLGQTTSLPRLDSSFSTESSSSAGDDQTHPASSHSNERLLDAVDVPLPAAPQNAFSELAAQIEREGIKATGTGGPAVAARKRQRGRRLTSRESDTEEEEEEEDDSSSENDYAPSKKRPRMR